MSSAHRPTWEPAKAKSDLSHMSHAFSKHALPAHTKLKFRRPGDTQKRSLDEMKAELAASEQRAYAERHPGQEFEAEEESKRAKLDENTAEDTLAIAPAGLDDDDDVVSDEDDEDEDDDEEDADELMRELEKIKQERREEQERREQAESAKEQLSREEEIARGNPLLNLEQALHGDAKPQAPYLPPQQRWDDDLIFRNQAAHADNGLSQRGFVNDLTLASDLVFIASQLGVSTWCGETYSHYDGMGRYAVLVTGPAGAGKSTFCSSLVTHAHSLGRSIHLFNLDPAAEHFEYEPSIDIRELITLEDVMEEMDLGPNGGLVYCFEYVLPAYFSYLLNNLDWLENELGNYDNDYLVIDCPGQIELYTHFPVITRFVSLMQQQFNFRVCATYLLDSHFMDDKAKYFAGVLSAMSAMINLDIPHLNIMTKMDLVYQHDKDGPASYARRKEMERYMDPDPLLLADEVQTVTNPKFFDLNRAIVQLIEDFSMVSFLPLDLTSEDSIELILSCIDNIVQFGEDEEPVEPKDLEQEQVDV